MSLFGPRCQEEEEAYRVPPLFYLLRTSWIPKPDACVVRTGEKNSILGVSV